MDSVPDLPKWRWTTLIKTDSTLYVLASREALQYWSASRRLILHRVATIHFAATEAYRKGLRRRSVLARLRLCVWKAACLACESESMSEKLDYVCNASHEALGVLLKQERCADYWRTYLLRSRRSANHKL
jgi:hypothetical protein